MSRLSLILSYRLLGWHALFDDGQELPLSYVITPTNSDLILCVTRPWAMNEYAACRLNRKACHPPRGDKAQR